MSLRILIIEDDTSKLQKVSKLLCAVEGVTLAGISECRDSAAAKRYLHQEQFDLLILDIVIPPRLDAPVERDGGLRLLQEIVSRTVYRRPQHVIILTAFSELTPTVLERFPNERWATLVYDRTSDAWEKQLRARTEHIVAAKQADHDLPVRYQSDLGVICALEDPELSSILRLPWDWHPIAIPHDHSVYYEGTCRIGDREIHIHATACSRAGLTTAAVQAMKLINAFRPRYIAMTGIAAGLRQRTSLGDVIAAEMSWDYGSGKYELVDDVPRFSISPNFIRLDPDVHAHIRSVANDDNTLAAIRSSWPAAPPKEALQIRIGPLASGAAVIADERRVREIETQQRKIVGIDMEAYAVFEAADQAGGPRPTAFCLKGVSDFADSEKDDDFQRYAAYTSSHVLRVLTEKHLFI